MRYCHAPVGVGYVACGSVVDVTCSAHPTCTFFRCFFCFFSSPLVSCSVCGTQDAQTEYVDLMKTEAGVVKSPKISIEEDPAKCLPAGW